MRRTKWFIAAAVAILIGMGGLMNVLLSDPLDGNEFITPDLHEAGPGGAQEHWRLQFHQKRFHWSHSDYGVDGTYVFRAGRVTATEESSHKEIIATYDAKNDTLLWERVLYRKSR